MRAESGLPLPSFLELGEAMNNGIVIEFKRLDETLTKAQITEHIEMEHSQIPPFSKRITKADLVALHRLIHFGLGR